MARNLHSPLHLKQTGLHKSHALFFVASPFDVVSIMHRYVEGTPCPAPHLSFASNRYVDHHLTRQSSVYAPSYSSYGGGDNTTANLDYTTEIQTRPQHAKPRRPMRGMRKSAFDPSLDIFEDVAYEEDARQRQQQQQQQHHQQQQCPTKAEAAKRSSVRASVLSEAAVSKNSTILAHKAQKIHLPAPDMKQERVQKTQRRRVSELLSDRQLAEANATVQLQEQALEKKELRKSGPQKDPRRRTIYVPSEDTTMITIHPGQSLHKSRKRREKSPDTGLELVTLSEEEPENLVSALKRDRRAPRKSLAVPPKRAPLLQTAARQGTSYADDLVGQGGGKENVPPGMQIFEGKGGTHIEFNFGREEVKKPAIKPARVHFSSKAPDTSPYVKAKTAGAQKRSRSQLGQDEAPAKSVKTKASALASATRTTTSKATVQATKSRFFKPERNHLSSSPFHTDRSPPNALRRQRAERAPTSIILMHEVGKPRQTKTAYPVLAEDLSRPEMYEDNWLTYQEVAITQLINSMFDSAMKDPAAGQSQEELRKKLLNIYHDPAMPALHKRLQASLQFGALSIPKDLLAQTLRLKDDVGLRKKFLNLWVKTYDLASLRAALETVVGRQITVPSRLSSGSTTSDDGYRLVRAERRAIENFIDMFLIRNEDAVRVTKAVGSIASIARGDHGADDFGSQGWSWRRTALRSLMLLYLLDKGKSADTFSSCLFQTGSSYKTSTDVLHALSNMLLPSHGDITRLLGHLNYKVEQVQYPLQEYTYHISNIAIDLRDGVVLTRLVELLFYPTTTLIANQDETVTINVPSGDILSSSVDTSAKESWVLSQHLKFPSIGRAQKLYNVQIALAALDGAHGLPVQLSVWQLG